MPLSRFSRLAASAVLVGAVLSPLPAAAVAAPSTGTVAVAGSPFAAKPFANCTALNKKYPHGVGKKGAKDKVSGKTKPVTNFTVSTALYNENKKSDRDKDGIACEKR
ncbi:excalibur calcium-binding domain-containing protein [Labedella endophytica]|uniref:Excalibur calcium-binding domain-containing protein n=1 Tax=Labedella endophytica TaxID=1523160 RepID=A0A433JVX8_9MICO|nr:excalibur calcium-binding domain-containing protein [Labedella endophytica]RUR03311.1 excalibur calcium-binding domain-containing protein [Labedella endophytica]